MSQIESMSLFEFLFFFWLKKSNWLISYSKGSILTQKNQIMSNFDSIESNFDSIESSFFFLKSNWVKKYSFESFWDSNKLIIQLSQIFRKNLIQLNRNLTEIESKFDTNCKIESKSILLNHFLTKSIWFFWKWIESIWFFWITFWLMRTIFGVKYTK